uniref:Uncharacterized protein n=1 Tax=Morchella brunnea TaxID=1174671 RepID=A0A8K1I7J0_9PEZI|nr:hypothetical protein LK370_mgp199 [Morchella brunnea]UBU98363.1 hypothetical protein [Morchella brunnea]
MLMLNTLHSGRQTAVKWCIKTFDSSNLLSSYKTLLYVYFPASPAEQGRRILARAPRARMLAGNKWERSLPIGELAHTPHKKYWNYLLCYIKIKLNKVNSLLVLILLGYHLFPLTINFIFY